MNKLKYNSIKAILGLFLLFSFSSCDEGGNPNPGGTSVETMSGDWYVELLLDGDDVYGLGYNLLSTYNTSSNNGTQMWIDDHELWPMKVKANVDTSTLTISGSSLENLYSYTSGGVEVFPMVTITNGEIIKNGATTTGGHTSDKISFNVEFSDDPGTIYQMVGYKRTGFLEDEH